ncbi:unnamed protein product [Brassica napus]|uniref:Uncharacterized protein n=2 Tax=Brassica TaxID=3705 RepID=A0A3P6DN77_BRAOL|nr:unnamed protein product [Brassica napus]VDD27908.1 unnamed protein product [Brassica oleracea]
MIAYCEFKKARIRAHAYFYIIFTQVCIFYTMSGACEASLECSTCHVIMMMIHNTTKKKLEEPTDDENDMLDPAFGLSVIIT